MKNFRFEKYINLVGELGFKVYYKGDILISSIEKKNKRWYLVICEGFEVIWLTSNDLIEIFDFMDKLKNQK